MHLPLEVGKLVQRKKLDGHLGNSRVEQFVSIFPQTAVKFWTAGCRTSINFFATVRHDPSAPKGSAARLLSAAVNAFSMENQVNLRRDGRVVSRIRSAGLSKLVNEQGIGSSSKLSIEAPGTKKSTGHTAHRVVRIGIEEVGQYGAQPRKAPRAKLGSRSARLRTWVLRAKLGKIAVRRCGEIPHQGQRTKPAPMEEIASMIVAKTCRKGTRPTPEAGRD
jgi:hypothetical protein